MRSTRMRLGTGCFDGPRCWVLFDCRTGGASLRLLSQYDGRRRSIPLQQPPFGRHLTACCFGWPSVVFISGMAGLNSGIRETCGLCSSFSETGHRSECRICIFAPRRVSHKIIRSKFNATVNGELRFRLRAKKIETTQICLRCTSTIRQTHKMLVGIHNRLDCTLYHIVRILLKQKKMSSPGPGPHPVSAIRKWKK